MDNLFTIIRQNRKGLYHFLKSTPREELFKIPDGFNNNIWWNIAHVVVTQQKLVYGLSGLPLNIDQELVQKYQKGTFPSGEPSADEEETIKGLLFSLPKKTEEDYKAGLFASFKPYMTTPKVELKSVEDAFAFNVYHEGLHLGSIFALMRAVKN
ncbi:DinB family protein [Croceitalea rosinachiae]|uniref:DinB family protein n=1 Tax=Croceitalea rosinachiae TaxID=3075596 RepID=A0ABU3ABP3_9FLAO|nr:DinB family protein [Croceitalea sp. F388]MDT0606523.1 DinB family protein [Croceitalea sp. F388]